MPVSYRVDKERNVVVTTGSGIITADECIKVAIESGKDPDVLPVRLNLADFREATSVQLSMDELREVTEIDRQLAREWPDKRLAIVATRDLAYGIGRMFAAMAIDFSWQIEVFRDLAPAEEWLFEEADVKRA